MRASASPRSTACPTIISQYSKAVWSSFGWSCSSEYSGCEVAFTAPWPSPMRRMRWHGWPATSSVSTAVQANTAPTVIATFGSTCTPAAVGPETGPYQ